MQAKETTILKMLSGTKVFLVPLFQRRYQWSGRDWRELWEDILEQYNHPDLVDGTNREGEGHFLGSIVLHPAPGPASTVTRYLVVDGQQRLITLLILLAVLRDERAQREPQWNSAAYDHQFLGNPFNPEHRHRLVPTARDRESYFETVAGGEASGQPGRAYAFFRKELRSLERSDGKIDFPRMELAVLLRLLVVDITTSVGDNVNHIFHTLNSAGQKLSPLDLVRNRIFMSLEQDVVDEAYNELWRPIETQLGDREAQRYLWAQTARSDPKATQKNLYEAFGHRLDRLAASTRASESETVLWELQRLHREAPLYAAVMSPPALESLGASDGNALPTSVVRALHELDAWGSLTHIPLSLEILSRFQGDSCTEEQAARSLQYISAFMVRRALCAIPTNNLNRIFTSLPAVLHDSPLDEQISRLLASEQRYWPSDEEMRQRIPNTPIYATAQASQVKFLLERLEWSMSGGETVDTDELEVEHVLPQSPGSSWLDYLSSRGDVPERTLAKVHTIGNLTLTGFNQQLGRQSFARKRSMYADSLVRLTSSVAEADEWTEARIVARSVDLAERCIAIWPGPARTTDVSPEERSGLRDLLLSLDEDAWTTAETLSEYFGMSVGDIQDAVNALDAVLAVKVLDSEGGLPAWVSNQRRTELEEELTRSGRPTDPPVFESVRPLSVDDLRDAESAGEAYVDDH